MAVTETKKETASTANMMLWINFTVFEGLKAIICNLTDFVETYWDVVSH